MRSENSEAIKVVALIFLKKGFLEECDSESYLETTELILNSPEEQMFRKTVKLWLIGLME